MNLMPIAIVCLLLLALTVDGKEDKEDKKEKKKGEGKEKVKEKDKIKENSKSKGKKDENSSSSESDKKSGFRKFKSFLLAQPVLRVMMDPDKGTKLDIPSDLAGKSDTEVMNYVSILSRERRILQRRMTYHIVISMITGTITYLLHTYTILLPLLSVMGNSVNSYRGSLDADWSVHQQQLSEFMLQYMKLKGITGKDLPKVWSSPSSKLKVHDTPNTYVTLPVWRVHESDELPEESKMDTMIGLIKNWYSVK